MNNNVYGVILAGGSGSRLWPLSRELFPKQFLKLNQVNTLFKSTFLRLSNFINVKNIVTVTNVKHSSDMKLQLLELKNKFNSDEEYNLISEPVGRNTAPAIALSILYILEQAEDKSIDPIIIVAPSDHLIKDIDKSTDVFQKSIKLAEHGYIVTFGVTPDKPDTGYGYINTSQDDTLAEIEGKAVKVKEFKEKPDLKTAINYCKDCTYYWNSGIFLFKASTMLNEFKLYCPDILYNLENAELNSKGPTISFDDYEKVQNISIDYAIMEHSEKIVLLPFEKFKE